MMYMYVLTVYDTCTGTCTLSIVSLTSAWFQVYIPKAARLPVSVSVCVCRSTISRYLLCVCVYVSGSR